MTNDQKTTKTVKVPWTDKWLTRFNKRFAVQKHWDGTFDSRLGPGYCTGSPSVGMYYTFIAP